jgi:hypothetical protein
MSNVSDELNKHYKFMDKLWDSLSLFNPYRNISIGITMDLAHKNMASRLASIPDPKLATKSPDVDLSNEIKKGGAKPE